MKSLPGDYDQASSGSDDESSVEHEPVVTTKQRRRELEGRETDDSSSEEEEESSDSSDDDSDSMSGSGNDDDSDSDSGSDDDGDSSDMDEPKNANDDNNDDNNEPDSDDPDLPLHERILRKERKGRFKLSESRQRKAKALAVAARKLAKYQKEKRKQHPEQAGEDDGSSEDETGKRPHKRSKHAPNEMSSKRRDFYSRGAPKLNESGLGVEIGANRYKPLDPRASNLSGHFNEDQFTENYQFLQSMRNQEIKKLKQHISARKLKGRRGQAHRKRLGITNMGSLEDDQEKLKELQQIKADWERKKLNRQAKRSVKQKLKSQVEEKGEDGVFYLKRKEKRRMEREAKMDLIRKSKGQQAVDKVIARQRKKQKSKDAKIFAR